ncbi:hypothetical protein ABFA07_016019 [Porites harrisoni]
MRAHFAFAILVNLVFTAYSSHVKELTLYNFDKFVDGERFVFVFFYASWEQRCVEILERYEEVGDTYADRDDVLIAKVNAYEEVKLGTRYWIDEYPSFRYFIKGSITEETYKGSSHPQDLIRFIQTKAFQRLNLGIFLTPVIDLAQSSTLAHQTLNASSKTEHEVSWCSTTMATAISATVYKALCTTWE